MNELIKLTQQTLDNEQVNTVNARELHALLEVKSHYKDWFRNRVNKYGFQEDIDYCCLAKTLATQTDAGRVGSSTYIDHYISLDMAKELSMVENNEKGREARKYFIQCEKQQAKALEALSNVTLDLSSNLVIYKDNDFYLSSISIAKELGKRHANILRDIENEVSQLKSESADFSAILEGFKEVINYLERQRYVLNSDLDMSFDTKLLKMIENTDEQTS